MGKPGRGSSPNDPLMKGFPKPWTRGVGPGRCHRDPRLRAPRVQRSSRSVFWWDKLNPSCALCRGSPTPEPTRSPGPQPRTPPPASQRRIPASGARSGMRGRLLRPRALRIGSAPSPREGQIPAAGKHGVTRHRRGHREPGGDVPPRRQLLTLPSPRRRAARDHRGPSAASFNPSLGSSGGAVPTPKPRDTPSSRGSARRKILVVAVPFYLHFSLFVSASPNVPPPSNTNP